MTEIKISISDRLKEEMQKHPETDWQVIMSNAIEEYIADLIIKETIDSSEELKLELEESKKMLDLKTNWDGLGSTGYKKEIWEKMHAFLLELATKFHKKYDLVIHTPYINPGSNGAIDLHWKTKKFELLLNIPEGDDTPINYYGDNYGKSRIKGTLEKEDLDIILTFMKMYY